MDEMPWHANADQLIVVILGQYWSIMQQRLEAHLAQLGYPQPCRVHPIIAFDLPHLRDDSTKND